MVHLENWAPEEVKAALDAQEIVLIDVRTPPEYMMEHIDGALLMPMAFFRPEALPTQDGKRIVLHCAASLEQGSEPSIAATRMNGSSGFNAARPDLR